MSNPVVICECFARDGLQHEPAQISTDEKVALIDAMSEAGFARIEATSYSHPKRVPGFADASEVLRRINRADGVHYKATCPNPRAIERALVDQGAGYGATELSLLVSATDSHSQRNLRSTRAEQWARVEEMVRLADGKFRLVGVISVALGCPFEGEVDQGVILEDVARFAELGAELVTIGDTVGTATPSKVGKLWQRFVNEVPAVQCVAHFHDTRGSAIANCWGALEAGCTHFDSAFGGVGGHPSEIKYGKGRTGNVATEDLVSLFDAAGVETGIDLDRMMAVSQQCEQVLGRSLDSKVARAGLLPRAVA